MPTQIQNGIQPVDSQAFQQAAQAEKPVSRSNSGLFFSADNMEYLTTHRNPGVAQFAQALASPEVLQKPSVVRHMAKAQLDHATDFEKYALDHESEAVRDFAARWIVSTAR